MGGDLFSLFLVWLLSKCRGAGGAAGTEYEPELAQPGWPGAPIALPLPIPANTAPAWPAAATQTGVPPFPGPGWEFDEPPPAAVKTRAQQLVNQLWATGTGSFRIERTGGRSIAYQAQVVASGRKGVVAYRLKGQRPSLPASSTATAARPAPRPQPRPVPPRPQAARPSTPAAPRPSAASPASSSPAARPAAAPARPAAAPAVQVVPSQLNLPTLKQGWGIKPAPPHKDVVLLQQRLGITADGRFGPGTDAAVRTFQRRNGLVVDGIVGQKTWAALFAVKA